MGESGESMSSTSHLGNFYVDENHHLIDMAHNLNITVCIEGIENIEEQEKIRKLLPDTMQGYLYGRPVSAKEFTEINISKYMK